MPTVTTLQAVEMSRPLPPPDPLVLPADHIRPVLLTPWNRSGVLRARH
jgi:hypothetical protein